MIDPRNKTSCSRGISMTLEATDRSYVGISMSVQAQKFVEEPILQRRSKEVIKRLGSPIQIIRENEVLFSTYGIVAPLQRISSAKTLSTVRTAWFIPGDDIQGGDYIFDLNHNTYYLFLVQNEYSIEGEYVGIRAVIARCNRVAAIYRLIDKPTGAGGITAKFEEIKNNIPLSIEFIKAHLRAEQPGLYLNSTHRAFLPSFLGLKSMDRVKVMDTFLRVDTIDSISFDNLVQITFSQDKRNDSS